MRCIQRNLVNNFPKMFVKVTLSDIVRVPPELLGENIKSAVEKVVISKYSGYLIREEKIYLIGLISVVEIGDSMVLPGDGGVYVKVKFEMLGFKPLEKETLYGVVKTVVQNRDGVKVNIGIRDYAFVHKSLMMDDYVEFNPNQNAFVGKNSKKTIKEGDIVIGKIVSVSLATRKTRFVQENIYEGFEPRDLRVRSPILNITMTMKQVGLGNIRW